jgi:NTE family protein
MNHKIHSLHDNSEQSPPIAHPPGLAPSAITPTGNIMKRALILGPGGSRVAYHLGILWVAEQAGRQWDQVYGISAGAVAGAFWSTGKIQRGVEIMKSLREGDIHSKHGLLWFALQYGMNYVIKTPAPQSIHNNEGLRWLLEKELGSDISKKVPFYAGRVCLEDDSYEDEVSDNPSMFWKEVLASASIPGYWPPVEIEGKSWVDGGIDQAASIMTAISRGANEILVITTDDIGPRENHKVGHAIEYVGQSLAIMMRNIIQRDIEHSKQYETADIQIITPPMDLGSPVDFKNKNFAHLLRAGEAAGIALFDPDIDSYRPIYPN